MTYEFRPRGLSLRANVPVFELWVDGALVAMIHGDPNVPGLRVSGPHLRAEVARGVLEVFFDRTPAESRVPCAIQPA